MRNGAWFTVDGSRLKTCKFCGCPMLYWAESKRTGKPYLANTRPYIEKEGRPRDVRWVMPNSPHKCEDYRARRERWEALGELDKEREDRRREYSDRLEVIIEADMDWESETEAIRQLREEFDDVAH